jgi:hypothetical protein
VLEASTAPEKRPATDTDAAVSEQDSTQALLSIDTWEEQRMIPEYFPFTSRLPSVSSSPDMEIEGLSSVE